MFSFSYLQWQAHRKIAKIKRTRWSLQSLSVRQLQSKAVQPSCLLKVLCHKTAKKQVSSSQFSLYLYDILICWWWKRTYILTTACILLSILSFHFQSYNNVENSQLKFDIVAKLFNECIILYGSFSSHCRLQFLKLIFALFI